MYDTMTKQVTAVHGNILELPAAPDTLFLQQVSNSKQEYGFRIEDRRHINDGAITHRGHLSGDGDVTGVIRASSEPAHLCRCCSAELRGHNHDHPVTNESVAYASYVQALQHNPKVRANGEVLALVSQEQRGCGPA